MCIPSFDSKPPLFPLAPELPNDVFFHIASYCPNPLQLRKVSKIWDTALKNETFLKILCQKYFPATYKKVESLRKDYTWSRIFQLLNGLELPKQKFELQGRFYDSGSTIKDNTLALAYSNCFVVQLYKKSDSLNLSVWNVLDGKQISTGYAESCFRFFDLDGVKTLEKKKIDLMKYCDAPSSFPERSLYMCVEDEWVSIATKEAVLHLSLKEKIFFGCHFDKSICCFTNYRDEVAVGDDSGVLSFFSRRGSKLGIIETQQSKLIALSMNEEKIVSGDQGGDIKVWERNTKQLLFSISAHPEGLTSVHMQGSYIASGGFNGSVKVWAAETGNSIHLFEGHEDAIESVQVEQNYLLTSDNAFVQEFDDGRGLLLGTTMTQRVLLQNEEYHAVRVWDLTDKKLITGFYPSNIYSTSYSVYTRRYKAVSMQGEVVMHLLPDHPLHNPTIRLYPLKGTTHAPSSGCSLM